MQNLPGIRLKLRATTLEHRTVLLIHDLYAQAFRGDVEQNLILELLELRIVFDGFFNTGFQLLELFGLGAAEFLLRRFQVDDPLLGGQVTRLDLSLAARQIFAAAFEDTGTVAAARTASQRDF